jgi:hypothetical protein
MDRIKQQAKQHINRTIQAETKKADTKVARETKGDADPTLADIAGTATNLPNQPKPCVVVPKTSGTPGGNPSRTTNMAVIIRLLPAILLAGVTAAAQTWSFNYEPVDPPYQIKTVLKPGMTIAGHVFDSTAQIGQAVISDTGEVAFVAHWPNPSETEPSFVFTLHRVVSDGRSLIQGQRLTRIASLARLAISPSGVVAYEAFYDSGDALGVFVEQHYHALAPDDIFKLPAFDFTVDNDGRVSMSSAQRPYPARNKSGQLVIPMNTPEGPFILVATPKK